MTEPLQDFHFKSNRYERPTCDWICGRASEGAACPLGPNRKGFCRHFNTCQPELIEDEFRCTRSKLNGGPCEEGAFPDGRCGQKDERCQPVRSIRSRRRLVTVWFSAMVFGFCIWLFASSVPSNLISPGELTFQHRGVSQDCSSCHTAAEGDNQHWVMSAFHSNIAIGDSKKCLVCHADLGTDALHAHGLSSEKLVSLTSVLQQLPKRKNGLNLFNLVTNEKLHDPNASWACASCHHEHKGIDYNLKTMSNDQCTSCHTNQFQYVGQGHPEFTDFPYERRTRIYFDHNTHWNHYFTDPRITDNQTISCNACHRLDAAKQTVLTMGYAKSCAKCHESQIKDENFPGVVFLQLPALDLELLKNHQITIGEWPGLGNAKRISKLPSFMKMLLESDPDYLEAMKDLGEFDFRDIETLVESQPKSVAKLLWSIKKLFHDVSLNGQKELRKRLGNRLAIGFEKTKPSLVDIFVLAQKKWFPNLVKKYYKSTFDKTLQPEPNIVIDEKNTATAQPRNSGGWYRFDSDLSIRFRPHGHADRFLKNWFEQSVKIPNHSKSNSLMQLERIFENPSASGGLATQGPVASGRCLLCHTVDRIKNGSQHINWSAKPSRKNHWGLNKFSHAPHVTSGNFTCVSCHRWESASTQAIYREEFLNFDSRSRRWKFESNGTMPNTSGFAPLNKTKCATCHNGAATGDNCLKCHNYHHRSMGNMN